jgi:predicted kinase
MFIGPNELGILVLFNYFLIIYGLALTIMSYSYVGPVSRGGRVSPQWFQSKKILTIVRGVPGIGKDYYVEFKEEKINDMQVYGVCNDDTYFMQNNIDFSMKKQKKAKEYTVELFLKYIEKGVNRIYVTNINQKIDDYQHFIYLATLHNYEVDVVTIDCYDKEHLEYFKTRSSNNITDTYLNNIYTHWEKDERERTIEPYVKYFMGDSLPKRVRKNVDLDLYWEEDSDEEYCDEEYIDEEYSDDEYGDEEYGDEEYGDEEYDDELDEETEKILDPDYNPESDSDEDSEDEYGQDGLIIPINRGIICNTLESYRLSFLQCMTKHTKKYNIIEYVSDQIIYDHVQRCMYIKKTANTLYYFLNNKIVYSEMAELHHI